MELSDISDLDRLANMDSLLANIFIGYCPVKRFTCGSTYCKTD